MTTGPDGEAEFEAAEAAGLLDLLLSDAALGVARMFRPDPAMLRFAARLARKPKLLAGGLTLLAPG